MRFIEVSSPGGPDVLQMAERETPECAAGEVLIKVAAAGVNRPDIMQRLGLYPPRPDASDILGLEVAGTIVAIGDGVSQWLLGDEVCALTNGGGYAEYVVAPASQCLPVPSGWSMAEAAALPETCFTVWSNVFERAALQPGETLLVHGGSSGIGVTAIQMAVARGSKVFVTAGSEEKCQVCIELGATRAVNYRTEDFLEVLLEETEGRGVDVILDIVGGDYVNKNLRLAAVDGRVVNIALQDGFEVTANMLPILTRRVTLSGSTLRPRSVEEKASIASGLKEHLWPLLESREIKPVIAAEFPLEKVVDAHNLMESSEHIGKIVLNVSG